MIEHQILWPNILRNIQQIIVRTSILILEVKGSNSLCLLSLQVYNVSSYVATHPGGDAILKNVEGDATEGFHHQPAHRVVKNHIASLLEKFYVGLLVIEKENFDEQP